MTDDLLVWLAALPMTLISAGRTSVRVHALSGPPFPLVSLLLDSLLIACVLRLILTTLASPVSSATSVLAFLSIGLVVITSVLSYLPSPNPFLSYLFPLSYRSFLLFIVWMMVAPMTPSHSILVPLSVPNTGKHGPCTGLCTNCLGTNSRVLAHVFTTSVK